MAMDEGNSGFSNLSINCTKLSDNEHVELIRRSQIAVPIIFGLILIFGIIGNGSVVWIVLKSKQMRTIPNIYIVSLALGDLLLILIAVPFSVFIYMFDEWYFGVTLCKVNFFMESFSLGTSVFTLTLLSIDRYLAISYPMQKRSGASVKKTVCRASSVWAISSCLAIPDVLSSGVIRSPCVTYCDPYKVNWGEWYTKFHVTYRFVIYFAIPILIIGVCYCSMAKALLCNDSGILVEVTINRQSVSRTHASRTQVAKLVLSFVVVFAVCWLPRHLFLLSGISPESFAQSDISPESFAQADISPESFAQADISPESLAQADISPESSAQADISPESLAQADISPEPFAQADISESNLSSRTLAQGHLLR
ncbi:neuropeptide CCHamide-1 receptor-like [Liolophura sinensis]|uniref:neuropeptide CCHamide-1 receptor-like n=1 Tax=Liolophura sinensis TaxID=3198878 RepID=UPI0031584DFE